MISRIHLRHLITKHRNLLSDPPKKSRSSPETERVCFFQISYYTHVVLGITMDGRKDIMGVWIVEHESRKFGAECAE